MGLLLSVFMPNCLLGKLGLNSRRIIGLQTTSSWLDWMYNGIVASAHTVVWPAVKQRGDFGT